MSLNNINPPVTWLIPIKNGMPYLTECLSSIYNQTYKNHKVLAWVNNCNDSTLSELQNWIPKKIPGKIISDFPIENLGACRAEMIKHADTELLALIDCDDINRADRLAQQVFAIQESDDIIAVGSWINIIDQYNNFISLGKKPINDSNLLMWSLLFECTLYQPTILLKKSMVLKANNYNHMETAQDYDLWLRLIRYGKIKIIEKPLVHYRKVKGSVSDENRKKWDVINYNLFKKYSCNYFHDINNDELKKLWESLSRHSKKTTKISIKFYLKTLKAFCIKNNIQIIDMIKNKHIRNQFLNKKNIFLSIDQFYLMLSSYFKSEYFLNKIKL